jgi:chromosomal replication initiation ATPase DnaA
MDNFVQYLDQYKSKPVDYLNFIPITNAHYYSNCLHDPSFTGLTSNYDQWQANHVFEPQIPIVKETVILDISVNSISDLIGVIDTNVYEPSVKYNIDLKALHSIRCELVELNTMIGMETLKLSVLNQLIYFIQEMHLDANKRSGDFKHTIICGPPGTGKTEVAKIIGRMYSKVGILKNNIFKKVTRSDLIAGYLGQTAIKTTKVITECLGGCLFIDEAYSLANVGDSDIYSKECIDTICEALSDHKDDLMVIIAGYEDELNETFFKVNCGLKSRFLWKFTIDEYDAEQMRQMFEKKVQQSDWSVSEDIGKWFDTRHKDFKHFGRDVEQLFSHIKICHSRRVFGKDVSLRKQITLGDMDAGYKIFVANNTPKTQGVAPSLYGFYL